MKNNSVVTNIQQDFTDEEKAQGRRNIDAGGFSKYIVDGDVTASGDLEIHNTSGDMSIQIGDQTIGGLLPEPVANTHLVADSAGKVMWTEDQGNYSAGQYISIIGDVISATGLQPAGDYLTPSDISGLHNYYPGSFINITDSNVINVTGLQPEGDYVYNSAMSGKLDVSAYVAPVQSDWNQNDNTALDFIKNKPEIPSLSGYATEEYVDIHIESATSGKLDASAYREYQAGDHIDIDNHVISVVGTSALIAGDNVTISATPNGYRISAIGGGGGGGGEDYIAGENIEITDDYVINVSGKSPLIPGDNISISATSSGYVISSTGGGGGSTYSAGQYIYITPEDVISVTGLQPAGDYATSAYVIERTSGKLDTSAYVPAEQSDWIENDVDDMAYIKNKPIEIGLVPGSGVWFENLNSAVRINTSGTRNSDILVYNFSILSPSMAVIPQAAGYKEVHITTPYSYDGPQQYSATIDSETWKLNSGSWFRLIYQWNDSNPSYQKWWLAESGTYYRPQF